MRREEVKHIVCVLAGINLNVSEAEQAEVNEAQDFIAEQYRHKRGEMTYVEAELESKVEWLRKYLAHLTATKRVFPGKKLPAIYAENGGP